MLKPSPLSPRLLRRANASRISQYQCLRLQSTSPPQQPPVASPKPAQPSPTEQQLQPLIRHAMQRPRFEKAPSESKKITWGRDPQAKSFHPALAGFIAGTMIAFTVSYAAYFYSGTFHIQKASSNALKRLNKEGERISLPVTGEQGVAVQDTVNWFYRTAMYYSGFMPNSEKYVETVRGEIEEQLKLGREKEVEGMVKECAAELRSEIGMQRFEIVNGLAVGKKGWEIVMRHLERIRALAEDKMNKK